MLLMVRALLGAVLIVLLSLFGLGILLRIGTLQLSEDNVLPKRWYLQCGIPFYIGGGAVIWVASTLLSPRPLVQEIIEALLVVFMILLTVVDSKHKRVPNRMLLIMLLSWVVIVCVCVLKEPQLGIDVGLSGFMGALFSGSVFLLCYLLSRRQLGGGDVKLSFLLGLYLGGDKVLGAVLYGVVCCCLYSLIQLWRKKLGLKDGVPLVPFLYVGVLLTYVVASW